MGNHLFDAIMHAAHRRDAPFLRLPSGKTWTYADMLEFSSSLAARLRALGVQDNDRVVAQVQKSPEALLLYVACVRAGAVFVPLNPGYTATEIEYFVSDAKPTLLVVTPEMAGGILPAANAHGIRLVTLDEQGQGTLMQGPSDASSFKDSRRDKDDLAAILYTSGTTGLSKGAMISHENLLSNALCLKDIWQFTDQDILIHALPIFHTHGLFVASNVVMLSGASMHFLPKFDAEQVISLMASSTCLMGVPTFYTRLLRSRALTSTAVKAMRLFISGSAPLLAETHQEFSERTGHAILERYGMTETNMITSNPYQGQRIAGTVGFPLPDVSLRIADLDSGQELGRDEIGMIEVRGPNVFQGYWGMPEKTASEFRADRYFITGDIGKIDPDGYVHIIGRGKDLIITGGLNVYPKEVEEAIDQVSGVVESAVVGVPHPDFGEGVVAVVVAEAVEEAHILGELSARLARYKQPKAIIFASELPRNVMGKVQKNILRDSHRDLFASAMGADQNGAA